MIRFFFIFIFIFSSLFSQEKENSLSTTKEMLIDTGLEAYYNKDVNKLKKTSLHLLNYYNEEKDSSALAKHFHYEALFHRVQYTTDSAFFYYHKSKNISKQLNDSLETGRRLLSIAVLQRKAKDFLGSEISAIEALQYLEPIKSYKFLGTTFNNLGIVSEELNQKKEAIYYYEEALKINELYKDESEKLYIINNLGLLYQKRKEYKKAIKYFKQGLSFDSIKIKHPKQYSLLLENLVISNFPTGEKNELLKKYNEVLSIRKKLKLNKELSISYINLAEYYIKIQDKNNASSNAKKALKYAKQTHNNQRWLEALQLLSDLTTGKQSKQYLQEYIQLNDSLIQKERQLKNQFAKIRYETDKKEKENGLLKTENEKIEAEVTYQKQQTTIGWLLFIVSLLALGSSILFFLVRRRRLIYQNQLQKAQAREKERQQIAKSLHDEVAGDLRLLHQKLQKSQLLEEAQKLNEVKDNVRNLSHKLSSVSFKKVSFKDQVINLVSDYFEPNFRIIVTGINDQEWQEINTSIKRLLYLSIRESIQNCKKYAQASKMTIHFSIHKKNVFLSIEDNGIGFDTNSTKKGIGLQNLEERLEELNGTLAIESEPNNGTKTYIQIPINA